MLMNEAPKKGWYIITTVHDAYYRGYFSHMKKRFINNNSKIELVFEKTQMYNKRKGNGYWNKSIYTLTVSMTNIKRLTKINEGDNIPDEIWID